MHLHGKNFPSEHIRNCSYLIHVNSFGRGKPSGNTQFAQDIAAWTFQESMVLRIDSTWHHRANETNSPEVYTINDQVVRLTFISHISVLKPGI
jgi:hypothetical protein